MYLGPDDGGFGDPTWFTGQGDGCALVGCVMQGTSLDIRRGWKSRSE